MKFSTVILCLLLAAAITSCKTKEDKSMEEVLKPIVLQNDSMSFVRDLPIQIGVKIDSIPVEIRRRTSAYDYTVGEVQYIFRGPNKNIGGEFYRDPLDSTKVGTVHILNPYFYADNGVHPGMKYSELIKIPGLQVKGSVQSRRMDFVAMNVTYCIDHPVVQLSKNGNIVDSLEVTRMIYKSPNDQD